MGSAARRVDAARANSPEAKRILWILCRLAAEGVEEFGEEPGGGCGGGGGGGGFEEGRGEVAIGAAKGVGIGDGDAMFEGAADFGVIVGEGVADGEVEEGGDFAVIEVVAVPAIEEEMNAVGMDAPGFKIAEALFGELEGDEFLGGDEEDAVSAEDEFGGGFVDEFGEVGEEDIVAGGEVLEEGVVLSPVGEDVQGLARGEDPVGAAGGSDGLGEAMFFAVANRAKGALGGALEIAIEHEGEGAGAEIGIEGEGSLVEVAGEAEGGLPDDGGAAETSFGGEEDVE